ncbi:group-specific protein [Bacillus thuringiensis YBT-1518]|uniref:Group-specific protein n=1 Tax=Bacillus thuringiensis YBT-1518 TaxID=529122 RepID=A0A9W3KLQ4_BACTU|nr:group-specific protein [Bacillus thuringiensis YBT-1518]
MKFADEGKVILIITYAIDLYVNYIPLKVKKYNSL